MKKIATLLLFALALLPILHAQTEDSVFVGEEYPHYLLGASELSNARTYRSVQECMKAPREVYKLSLKGQNLKELPEILRECTNLQYLDLSENKFTTLPEWLGEYQYLQVLNLYKNRLVRLPSSTASLIELTTLYLGDNRLPEMPLWVGGLGKLRTLDVSYNGLTPYEIETLMRNLPKCQITH